MTTADGPIAERIAEIGRCFYDRGWVLDTSGNFSAVLHTLAMGPAALRSACC
jgi:ribulose-5-phosphate 4-epimerase/fuculose-1-phosphate aldolase